MTFTFKHRSLRRIWAVLKKEFIQLKRDRTTLGMIAVIPLTQLLLFGYAINTDPKHLTTAVIAQDHSIFSRNIIAAMKNSDYFAIMPQTTTESEGKALLQQGKVSFVITIPEGFSRALIRGDKPNLLIEADATDPITVGNGLAAMNGIMGQIISHDANGALLYLRAGKPPYNLIIHRLYNPEGLSRYNIVPGLIGVILTMTGVMMTALALIRERERGTIENLLSMPVKPIEVMAGKISPYIIISYIQAAIILLTANLLFAIPIIGTIFILAVALFMFIVCNLALGFTLSAIAENQLQAMQMSIFIILPSILLTGFMFPFYGMPTWAQWIGSILPNTYFVRITRAIMLKGSSFPEIWVNIWPLMLFMIIVSAIAMKVYRRTLD